MAIRQVLRSPTTVEGNLLDRIGDLTASIAKKDAALRSAKRLIAEERRSQFDSFTIAPQRGYSQMNPSERAAICRFDRALRKIKEAMR